MVTMEATRAERDADITFKQMEDNIKKNSKIFFHSFLFLLFIILLNIKTVHIADAALIHMGYLAKPENSFSEAALYAVPTFIA